MARRRPHPANRWWRAARRARTELLADSCYRRADRLAVGSALDRPRRTTRVNAASVRLRSLAARPYKSRPFSISASGSLELATSCAITRVIEVRDVGSRASSQAEDTLLGKVSLTDCVPEGNVRPVAKGEVLELLDNETGMHSCLDSKPKLAGGRRRQEEASPWRRESRPRIGQARSSMSCSRTTWPTATPALSF